MAEPRLGRVAGACLALGLAAAAAAEEPPEAWLSAAFEKRYETESLQRLSIEVRGPAGVLGTRELELATKRFDGRLYVLGRFQAPPRMRGTAFLAIERASGSDYFVYLPAFSKVRRVSSYQRSDSWFETDLSFEDVERHAPGDYAVVSARPDRIEGEAVRRIVARPRYASAFDRVEFAVADADRALLEIRYFASGRDTPAKQVSAPRRDMIELGGHVIPGRILARDLRRGSETEVIVREVAVDPAIGEDFFSTLRLEVPRDMPFPEPPPSE